MPYTRPAFEPTRFHYQPNYRKHWAELTPQPDFEVRAWAVGQAAALRQAVEVLRARADRAAARDAKTPWPEFTEGSCFACHQTVARSPYPDAAGAKLRGAQGERTRPSGAVPWQPWYESLGTPVAKYHDVLLPGVPGAGKVDLTELRAEMEKPYPNPGKVAGLARAARDDLDRWLAVWQAAEDGGAFPPVTHGRIESLAAFVADGAVTADGKLRDYDWDFVAQRYLGLTAFYHAGVATDPALAPWRGPLVRLRGVLDLPRPRPDPLTGTRSGFDSPVNYRPSDAAVPLGELRRIITTSRSGR